MTSYQKIIYPIRRIDGFINTGESVEIPATPTFTGVTVSGQSLSINGVLYSWPLTQASTDTYLSTDGSGNLSWVNIPGIVYDNKIQDLTNNTYVDVDAIGDGSADTISLVANDSEVQQVTEQTSKIKNSIDVSEKFTLTQIAAFPPIGSAIYYVFRDNYIYSSELNDLIIVDTTYINATNITHNATLSNLPTNTLVPNGRYLYNSTTDVATNIEIIDISNKTVPVSVGNFPCPQAEYLVQQGSYLYANCGSFPEVLNILDISNPTVYSLRGSTSITPSALEESYGVILKNNVLYTTYGTEPSSSQELKSFDITDPDNPVLLDTLILSSINEDIGLGPIYIIGNFLYISRRLLSAGSIPVGIISVNITDPSNLSIAQSLFPFSSTNIANNNSFVAFGKYAYFINSTISSAGTVTIFNITDPYNMVTESSISLSGTDNLLSFDHYKNNFFGYLFPPNDIRVYQTNVGNIQLIEAGSTKTNILDVDGDVNISHELDIEGGLVVNAGLLIGDDFTINDDFQSSGSFNLKGLYNLAVRTSSGTTEDLDNDHLINAQNSSTATYNLPPIDSTRTGTTIVINKITTNNITLTADGADLIWDGVSDTTTKTLISVNPNEITEVFCNGVKWFIV